MRTAGILLPITSLPSPFGVGTLGQAAYSFIDFLALAGQSLWQILPTNPTGFGDSPYQSFSAFAGNPYYIDLDLLCAGGLLLPEEIGGDWGDDPALVDYSLLFRRRFGVLARAAARQNKASPAYRAFCARHAAWLDDYALYMAIKKAHGQRGFAEWPEALRRREPAALKAARAQYGPQAEFWRCLQYFFYEQWADLRAYAAARGVRIVGDIPIYVSDDSSDLWANPGLFQLDENGRPARVAGVPPDAFGPTGQLWGNPLYDWRAHKRTKYAWWLARLAHAHQMFDITRIDHFRGFASYWSVPAGQPTAENGQWVQGPGMDFLRAVRRALPDMQIIAEDLGFLTPEVHKLLAASGYPGMKILQFAFDSREQSDYLPHNYQRNCVVYTGTHDNTTTRAWGAEAPPADVRFARRYLGIGPRQPLAGAMVRAALASVADTAVAPMQDWLDLDVKARFNTPSTLGGRNWRWRLLPGQLTGALAGEIRLKTRTYGRLSAAVRDKDRARVLTSAGMKAAEEAAVAAGGSYRELMENAGAASARAIAELTENAGLEKRATLLCGKGNNAGDAFVAARLLCAEGWRVRVVLLCGEGFSELAALNYGLLPAAVEVASGADATDAAPVLVDGVFGTGFHGALPAGVEAAFAKANAAALRVALDVPSGVNCDTGAVAGGAFRAEHTLTFGAYKPALTMPECEPWVGEVLLLDIGL